MEVTDHNSRGHFRSAIYFSSIDWRATWQRPQQLASRLGEYGELLYVNPLGLRSPRLEDFPRIVRRVGARSRGKEGNAKQGNLAIHTPLAYLPFPDNPLANKVNGWLLRNAVMAWLGRHGGEKPVIWVSVPAPAVVEALRGLPRQLLVYDCLDNFASFHQGRRSILDAERALASESDVVFATADELFERMCKLNPNTFRLPNGADFEHFSPAAGGRIPSPPDIEYIKKPILGYVGEIAWWFDFDLVRDLATQNPAWSIVLIGQAHEARANELARLPNVHMPGRKPYSELPAYLSRFDVCLLPFKINDLTSAVNPVKLYEYLAAGKPVVSTPMREVLKYRDVVSVAEPGEFSAAVSSALRRGNEPALVQRRQEVARRNSWEARVTEILRVLDPLCRREAS